MSKNYAIIIQFVLPLTPFYRSGARRRDVYKRDAFVTTWRFHNRAWQPERRDGLPETSGTLWIHRGALTNQRCSLATGCGIIYQICWLNNILLFFFKVIVLLKGVYIKIWVWYLQAYQLWNMMIIDIATKIGGILSPFFVLNMSTEKICYGNGINRYTWVIYTVSWHIIKS